MARRSAERSEDTPQSAKRKPADEALSASDARYRRQTMKNIETSRPRAWLAFLLVFLLLAAGIVIAGWFYTRKSARNYRAEVERQLSAIADL